MRDFLDDFPLGSNRAALAPVASDSVAQLALTPNVHRHVAIPTGARFVQFSAANGGDIWALFGTSSVAAAIGATGVAGANAALNIGARRIPAGATHISIISKTATDASVEFWG